MYSLADAEYDIVFLTGRSEKYRDVTERWLSDKCHINAPHLIMRDNEDWRSAAEYKDSQIKKLLKLYTPQYVLAVDDDYDGDTAAVYKSYGIVHLKVQGIL